MFFLRWICSSPCQRKDQKMFGSSEVRASRSIITYEFTGLQISCKCIAYIIHLHRGSSRLCRSRFLQVSIHFQHFRNLQDVHSFAPLKTQIFNKILSFVCCKISNSSFAKPISWRILTNFLTNFDEFWRNVNEIWRNLTKSDEIDEKFVRFRQKFVEKVTNEFVIRQFLVTNSSSSAS